MKKLLLILSVLLLTLVLVACGGTADTESDVNTDAPADGTDAPDTKAETDSPETEHEHDLEEQITASTCTANGTQKLVCRDCGEAVISEAIPKLNHIPVSAATCTEDSVCSMCNEVVAEKLGHTYGEPIVQLATCVSEGKTTIICTTCGATEVETTPIGEHVISGGEHKEATCTEEGYNKGTCSACKTEQTLVLPKLAHAYTEWEIKEDGYASTCDVCAAAGTLKASETPALALTFDQGSIAAELDGKINFSINDANNTAGVCEGMGDRIYLAPTKSTFVDFDSAVLKDADYYTVTFEVMFPDADRGVAGKCESIFSFVPGYNGGASQVKNADGGAVVAWNWLCKYDVELNRLGTNGSSGKSTDTNSVEVTSETWYTVTAIVNNTTGKTTVFINGENKGTLTIEPITDATIAKYEGNFCIRFYDNLGSKPCFDNFAITEIK